MSTITLTRGHTALVDDEDFDWLVGLGKWRAHGDKHVYAVRTVWNADRTKSETVRLHRLLMPSVAVVDHINGNTLDNRRQNLRAVSSSQNSQNRSRRSGNRSGMKGVVATKNANNPWRALIWVDQKPIHLGVFVDVGSAARAYDAAAIRHFGEYARLNFPEETPA